MNESIRLYFETLIENYGEKVSLTPPESNDKSKQVPVKLHPLYEFTSKAILPFGEIFTVEEAFKQSEKQPFKPKWFVFGKDNYFSYWLCSIEPDEDGMSFTYWDHESGNEIDGAVWSDLVSFLKEIETENER